jgi:uncharacterized protein (TIGR00290 family)
MAVPETAWMSWSSGKDSALALQRVRERRDLEVVGLLTTVNSVADRVSMHGVRRTLLEGQAAALGLPLHVVELPWPCPNGVYEERMKEAVVSATSLGISAMVFGDLFLENIRAYREQALAGSGIRPVFPLWQRPTDSLAGELIGLGLRAVIACVDLARLPASLAGRWYDEELLAELPPTVDPCGENGEFHTFVVDGPGFAQPVEVNVGEVVERDGFAFADLVPMKVASSGRAGSTPG